MVEPRRSDDPEDIGRRFQVLARLGEGGFGTVYAARAGNGDGTLVAVKRVHEYVLERVPDFHGRFRQEIGAIRRVKSDYVPAFMGAGPDADRLWLATQLVPGLSLGEILVRAAPGQLGRHRAARPRGRAARGTAVPDRPLPAPPSGGPPATPRAAP